MELRFFESCNKAIAEALKRLGHTLWIDPKGKIIDITGKPDTHYSWLAKKYKQTPESVWSFAAKAGWIQVRNHSTSLSFSGTSKKAMKKNKKIIFDIIDNRLFNGSPYDWDEASDSFLVDFDFRDEDANLEGKRITFKLPDDDSKLRRFL
jgi:hypothetical protein